MLFQLWRLLAGAPDRRGQCTVHARGDGYRRACACAGHKKPRLYITKAAIHNRTGASIFAVVAHRLLKLAELHDLTIIEDDIFADFDAEPSPRLAAFDGLERVLKIGSFAETLSPAASLP